MIPYGYCHCGCGEKTRLAPCTDASKGWKKGEPLRFRLGHNGKTRRNGDGRGHVQVFYPNHPRAIRSKHVHQHILVAEKALGKFLPEGTEVHHVDGDGSNNEPSNLVVCQDHSHHFLLHRREVALKACGHANWRKCSICHEYDKVENLWINVKGRSARHRACHNEYEKKRVTERSTG